MSARAEFVLVAIAGAAVTVLGYLAASQLVFRQSLAEGLRSGAQWSPAGALAALAAAIVLLAWHGRALRRQRRWGAAGMAARATVLALLLYPLAMACWVFLSLLSDHWFASPGTSLRESLRWLPSIVLYTTIAALVVGTLPTFAVAFALARRYLRRAQGDAMESA